MTLQEQNLIQGLIDRVRGTQVSDKDPDAERMLQQGLGQTPDSLYILSQTVIVQQFALEQAQRQLSESQAELRQIREQAQPPAPPQKHASFLGSIFGSSEQPAPTPPPPPPVQSGGYAPVPSYSPSSGTNSGYTPPPPMASGAMPQGGGFLRGAAQTAAGVAAGALAFEGVESLLHGFGREGGGMASSFGGFGGSRPKEVITNNYYGTDDHERERSGSDVEDRRGDQVNRGDNDDPGSNIFTGDEKQSDFAGTSSTDDSEMSTFDDGGGSASDDLLDGGNFDDGSSDDNSFDDGGNSSDDSSF